MAHIQRLLSGFWTDICRDSVLLPSAVVKRKAKFVMTKILAKIIKCFSVGPIKVLLQFNSQDIPILSGEKVVDGCGSLVMTRNYFHTSSSFCVALIMQNAFLKFQFPCFAAI